MKKRFWCRKHTTLMIPPERCRDCLSEENRVYLDALIRILALHDRRDLLDAQTIAEEAIARGADAR